MKFIKRGAISSDSFLFYIFLALPLFYVADFGFITRALRFTLLLAVAALALTVPGLRKRLVLNYLSLSKIVRAGLILAAGLALASSLLSSDGLMTAFFGRSPEYLGLVSWLCFVLVGLLFGKHLKHYTSGLLTNSVLLVIILASLYVSLFYIHHELRIPGLMLQATSMGMYAALTLHVGLQSLLSQKHRLNLVVAGLLVLSSFVVVLLTQSRVAFVAVVLLSALLICKHYKSHTLVVLIAVGLSLLVIVLPRLNPTFFDRFQQESVSRGMGYRIDLYRTAGLDVISHNVLIGNGANSLPTALNNQNEVPEDIQATLQSGNMILSTHDLYFDAAYYFGVVVAGLLLLASMYALVRSFAIDDGSMLAGMVLVSVLNAFVNVPSLELTPLLFITILSILGATNDQTISA